MVEEVVGKVKPAKPIKTDLKKDEVVALRNRVVFIKNNGHEAYLDSSQQAIFAAEEVFGNGVKEITPN